MRPSSFSLMASSLIFHVLLVFHGGVNVGDGLDIIDETCRKAANSDPKLSYNFCVASLHQDPGSRTANLQELGVISMDLCEENATYMHSYMEKLLDPEEDQTRVDPRARKYLKDCLYLYENAIPDVEDAIKAFEGKDYFTANIKMSAVMDASTTCEDGFKEEKDLVSPLAKEDSDFFQLTATALAVGVYALKQFKLTTLINYIY
ncbi:Pectinesterase inhibitor domain [Macleaya cordata]|uniref:Pectinesterase inhibitor domain n=1 Tax=Macleaya cordata TaxID=56857 RepID=A0A200QFR3_MACCD|nr:Pectinesterase inhibitor domain [Macleaya cordata]